MMEPQPPNQKFLFVNKDSSSQKLSQSAQQEQYRILSHVRSSHAVSKQPWERYSTVFDTCEDHDASNLDELVGRQDRDRSMLVQDLNHNVDSAAQPRTGAPWLKTLKHNESVYAYLSRMQPFFDASDSSNANIDTDVRPGSHHAQLPTGYHNLGTIYGNGPLESSSALGNQHSFIQDATNSKQFRLHADDDLLFYSSVAHGSTNLAWKTGQIGDDRSQFWIGRTLQGLRQRLAKPLAAPDAGVVLSVFTLALAALTDAMPKMWSNSPYEIDVSQFETCRIHLRAMLTLVEQAGGWHKFNPHALGGMLLVDKYTALYTLSRPLIPLSFDPSDEHLEFPGSTIPAQDAILDLATGFLDLDIDPQLQQILQSAGKFYHKAAGIWKPEVNLTPQQENLVYRRFQAIHYRLLLLETTTPGSELVRLATLVVLCNITLYTAGLVFTRVMSCHLRERMKLLSDEVKPIDRRIWYWCLCTGATTRLASTDKTWFTEQFLLQIARTHPSLPTIRRSMTKYLYIPWLQDTELEKVLNRSPVIAASHIGQQN